MEWGLGRRPTMQNPVGQLADRWVLQKKKGTHVSACFLISVLLYLLRNR